MKFSRVKLPELAVSKLKSIEVKSIQPYSFVFAPVYIQLKLNQKFLAIKAPLDFFTSEELIRLESVEKVFISNFIDLVEPFRETARQVKKALTQQPLDSVFSPAPYELSDTVLRLVGPLWSDGLKLEPFFIAAFVEELCSSLSSELLVKARDKDVEIFERAVFESSCAVFLGLHLGHCEIDFLKEFRNEFFAEIIEENITQEADEFSELKRFARSVLEFSAGNSAGVLSGNEFLKQNGRIAQKLASRLRRVANQFVDAGKSAPTIFGPEGFVDV